MTGVQAPEFRITETIWLSAVLVLSAAVLLLTWWCLAQGITIIFMHVYYFPIVLMAYHYRWKGAYGAALLSFGYLALSLLFAPGDGEVISGVVFRVSVFIGIAVIIAYLSERLATVQEKQQTMQQFQESVIANANVWIAVLALDGSILVWNNAAEQISGYRSSDVVGKKGVWKQMYPDTEYRRKITAEITRITASDRYLENFETIIRCADGTTKTIAWNTRILKDNAGKTTGYIALGRDVTAQKDAELRAQESAGFLLTMLDTLPMPVFFKDKSGRYLGCNPPFEDYIGIKRKDLVGKSVYDISPKDLADRYTEADRQVFENPVPQTYETQVQYADGSRHDVIFTKAPFFDRDGSVAGLIGAFFDITERKKSEQALQDSEERFRHLYNTMSSGVAVFEAVDSGRDFIFRDLNRAGEMIENVKNEDILGRRITEIFPGVADFGLLEVFRTVWQDGVPRDYPVSFYADGRISGWRENHVYRLPSGEIVAVYEDVTEKKTAEEALQKSEEKYRTFFSTSQDCVFITTADGTLEDVNDVAVRMFGYESRQDLLGTNALALYANPDERTAHLKSVRENGFSFEYPVDMKKKDGTVIHTLISSAVRHDAAGTVIGYQGTIRDISDRKADEDRIRTLLRVQEEQLRIINTSPAVAFLWKAEENWPVEMVSGNISQFGYTMDDFLSGRIQFSGIIHPDDLAQVSAEVEYNSSHGIDDYIQKYRIFGHDGTIFWVEDYTHIRRDPAGNITHYEGLVLDITERVKAEEALEKSEHRSATLLRAIPDMMFIISRDGIYRDYRVPDPALLAVPADRIIGTNVRDSGFGTETTDTILQNVAMTLETKIPRQFDYELDLPAGKRQYEARLVPLSDDDALGIIRDITERRQMEKTIRESEQKFREIFDNANDAIEIAELNDDGSPGRFIDMNAVACRMLHYSKDELLGRGPLDINTETFSRPFGGILEELKTVGHATFETEHRTKDGTVFPVEINAHIVTLLGKKVILSVVRDITERRAAEAEIRRSRQLFADIISFLPDPTIVIDREGKVLAWNRAIERLSGMPAEDIIGRGNYVYSIWLYGRPRPILIDLVLHPDRDAGRMDYLNIRREGSTLTAETTATLQSGKEIVLSLVASPLFDEKGEITGAIESMRDITRIKETEAELARMNAGLEKIVRERTQALQDEVIQRKYAEQEAQDALAYTRSVIEANPDLMVVLDMEGRILDINGAGTILTGIPREELLGQKYFGYLEDDGTLETAFARLLAEGSIENFVRIRHTDGHRTPLSVHAVVVSGCGNTPDRIIVSAHDITRQKADEAAIKASLDEKVILLREIHHRVKNNLQIIISLTNLQMRNSTDPSVKQMMAETQNRVRAMSLVHEKLYRSESLSQIDFAEYTRFLATQLFSFYTIDTRRVNLDVTLRRMMVDINTAVPLGLIMNELVSNALKHAFSDGRKGTLAIRGGTDEKGQITLVIGDDGVGVPPDFDLQNSPTLGMRLVTSLVDQIGGSITLDTRNGTVFTIAASIPPYGGGKE